MASALATAFVAHPESLPPAQQYVYPPPPSTGLSVNTYEQQVPGGMQPYGQQVMPAYPAPGAAPVAMDPEAQKDNAELDAFLKDLTIKDRMVFLRKVYMVLFFQMATTAVVMGIMLYSSLSWRIWLLQNTWFPWFLFGLTIVALGASYAKRKSYPANMICLCIFTGLEAVSVGSIVVFYEASIVLNAWICATFVFVGLSLFALQTKKDFTGLYPFLAAALMTILVTGLLQLMLPYNSWTDVFISFCTGLIFSAYIVVDTQTIFRRFHKDDVIPASIMLFLDFINLFLALLRIIAASKR